MPEYLDPSIANEGQSANNWQPGAWTNTTAPSEDEYQPDIEPPHNPDYAMLKKHKHYRQYFRPYRYVPFPAYIYHPTQEPKLIAIYGSDGKIDNASCEEAVRRHGPEWSPKPYKEKRADMTGKSLPSKSDTQRLTEALVSGLTDKKGSTVDANSIAAIVAATMAALNSQNATPTKAPKPVQQPVSESIEPEQPVVEVAPAGLSHDDLERSALIELAEKESVKIDKRWSNQRIKDALGLKTA